MCIQGVSPGSLVDVICSLFFLCVFFNEDLPAVSEQLCMPPCLFLLSLCPLDCVSRTPYFRRVLH